MRLNQVRLEFVLACLGAAVAVVALSVFLSDPSTPDESAGRGSASAASPQASKREPRKGINSPPRETNPTPAKPSPAVPTPSPGPSGIPAAKPDPQRVHQLVKDLAALAEDEGVLAERLGALDASELGPVRKRLLELRVLNPAERKQLEVLAMTLAKSNKPGRLPIVGEFLALNNDLDLQLKVVRALPRTPAAARSVGDAIAKQFEPGLRCLLVANCGRLLGRTRDPETEAGLLVAAVGDTEATVRLEAVRVLGLPERAAHFQRELGQILETDGSLDVRVRAIQGYARSGPSATERLAKLTQTPTEPRKLRYAAILGLGTVGTPEAAAALEDLVRAEFDGELRTLAEGQAGQIRARKSSDRGR